MGDNPQSAMSGSSWTLCRRSSGSPPPPTTRCHTPSKKDREESGNLVFSTKSPFEESYSFACLAKGKVSYLVTEILIQKPPRPRCGWLLLLLSLQTVPSLPTLLLPGTNSHPDNLVDSTFTGTCLFPAPMEPDILLALPPQHHNGQLRPVLCHRVQGVPLRAPVAAMPGYRGVP